MTFLTTSFLSNDSNRRKQHSIHHYLKYIKEIRVRLMTQTHISTVYTWRLSPRYSLIRLFPQAITLPFVDLCYHHVSRLF